jgi:hypothetical protein
VLTLLLAAALLCLGAGAGAALLCRALVPALLALYVLAVAEIVVLTEALSLVHGVYAWAYVGAEAAVAAAALAVWNARGRPLPLLPRLDLAGALRRHPVLAALALVVALALAYQAFLVVTVPPNTWDAMTYHLSRAAGWSQAHAVTHLDAHTTRENVLPPNGEIQILWTLTLLGGDRLVGAPQLGAELALLVAVFGCARRLGFPRGGAAFASLLFATLTQVALQATSTQNDLATAAPVAGAAYFVLGRTRPELLLAGAAVGLAVGTKLTALVALPLLLALAVAVLPRRRLALLTGAVTAGVLALGAYGYAANIVHDGTPLGRSAEAAAFEPHVTARGTASTIARVYWDLVDLSGVSSGGLCPEWVGERGRALFRLARVESNPPESTMTDFGYTPNTRVDEDTSYFGPLGALLVAPLALVFAWAVLRRRATRAHLAFALALPFFVAGVAVTHRYDVWVGRFLILPVALTMPLAAAAYRRRPAAAALAALGAVTLVAAHAQNLNKLPENEPWRASRVEAMTARQGDLRPTLRWLDARVPRDARLGVRLGPDEWDYPLYGPTLDRTLVNLRTLDDADGLRWVVVGSDRALRQEPGWREVRFANGWRVYTRASAT